MAFRSLRFAMSTAAFLMIAVIAATSKAQNPGAAATTDQVSSAQSLPDWAYPPTPPSSGRGGGSGGSAGRGPGAQPPADPGPALHVPGSSASFTAPQVRNLFEPPDWFPEDHPPMPDAVAHGNRANGAWACAYCHLPNGFGRTENQSIAGLPAEYIAQQVAEIKSGVRKTSGPRIGPVNTMVRVAQSATNEEVKIAAAYFASIKPKPWVRVVETDSVPVTKVVGPIWVAVKGGGTEPIGVRIVELAEDQELFELRDDRASFIAYVPEGSIAKGKLLVTASGGGKTISCAVCHGQDLKGLANIPSLAGRSPSQLARQIIDIQNGNRNGAQAALMKPVVANLNNEDIVNITAYLASLAP